MGTGYYSGHCGCCRHYDTFDFLVQFSKQHGHNPDLAANTLKFLSSWSNPASNTITILILLMLLSCRLLHLQSELESTVQRTSTHAQSLQASLATSQKEREGLHCELHQARSTLESRASEHEYMQCEASSLQQALRKQVQETQQAHQACDGWMSKARQQVVRSLSKHHVDSSSIACISAKVLGRVWMCNVGAIPCLWTFVAS